MFKKRFKKRDEFQKNVVMNFYTLYPEQMDRNAALDVLEEIVSKLECDFPQTLGELKFFVSFESKVIDKIRGFDLDEDGNIIFPRKPVYFSASETKEHLPNLRGEIMKEGCSYSLYNSKKQRMRSDFSCFVRQQFETSFFCTVGVSMNMRPEIYEGSFKDDWISLCERLAGIFSASGGFSDFTNDCNNNSYVETSMQRISGKELIFDRLYNQKNCDTLVSGYHWCVLLTDEHIRRLGGRERIIREAPCYKKHLWTIAGKEAIFLQATENLFGFTTEQRLKLKTFLEPVLPLVDPLVAAVEETWYKGIRMDNIVFSPDERAAIDELEKKYTPEELNKMLAMKWKECEKSSSEKQDRHT